MLVVENDSGVFKSDLDAREVEYDLRTPNGSSLGGDPGPATTNASVITEHQSNKSLKESSGTHGQFEDEIGTGGDRIHSGTKNSCRYFTLTVGGKQMGVLPIKDRFGTHIVDSIQIISDAAHPANNHTVLNGHGPTEPTDVP